LWLGLGLGLLGLWLGLEWLGLWLGSFFGLYPGMWLFRCRVDGWEVPSRWLFFLGLGL
jgi:hypothetical protein